MLIRQIKFKIQICKLRSQHLVCELSLFTIQFASMSKGYKCEIVLHIKRAETKLYLLFLDCFTCNQSYVNNMIFHAHFHVLIIHENMVNLSLFVSLVSFYELRMSFHLHFIYFFFFHVVTHINYITNQQS